MLFSPRSSWPAIPHRATPACDKLLEISRSTAAANNGGAEWNWGHAPAHSSWPCSFSSGDAVQVVETSTTIPPISNPHNAVWCPEKLYSGGKQSCLQPRAALSGSQNRFVLSLINSQVPMNTGREVCDAVIIRNSTATVHAHMRLACPLIIGYYYDTWGECVCTIPGCTVSNATALLAFHFNRWHQFAHVRFPLIPHSHLVE